MFIKTRPSSQLSLIEIPWKQSYATIANKDFINSVDFTQKKIQNFLSPSENRSSIFKKLAFVPVSAEWEQSPQPIRIKKINRGSLVLRGTPKHYFFGGSSSCSRNTSFEKCKSRSALHQ
jgi:hypothetical protein